MNKFCTCQGFYNHLEEILLSIFIAILLFLVIGIANYHVITGIKEIEIEPQDL